MEKRKLLHMTLYCSAISPCSKYLAVGDNYGFITLFNLSSALSSGQSDIGNKPICVFKAHSGPIHALETVSKTLVSAGHGPIIGWKWSDLISSKPSKFWILKKDASSMLNANSNFYNCIKCNAKDNILYSGGDDSSVVAWDLKTGTITELFQGHSAYIHDIDVTSNVVVSGSEDGCVKIWDPRTTQCTKTVQPYNNTELSRSEYGKWISCVASDSNGQWIACGGGPRTSLWHLRSCNLVSALPDKSEVTSKQHSELSPNTITFFGDEIIAGGNQANIHRWYLNGQSKAVIPCTISNVFSTCFRSTSNKEQRGLPMAVTGNSCQVNLFTNLGYLGSTLSLA